MAAVDTGRYSIMNVKFLNLAVLPDPNDESDIVARSDENNAGEKVLERHNRKYSVKNLGFANFAGCDTRAEKGDNLRGRVRNQQWIIKETRIKGQFTISPTDADLFWGLSDAKFDTPITLVATANDTKNQWVFTKASA